MNKNYFNIGIFLLRVWVAIVFFKASIPSLVSTNEIVGFSQYLESLEVPFPLFSAYCARIAEFTGAVLILSGFYIRIGAALIAVVMTVATFVASNAAIFYEGQVPFIYLLLAIFFILVGPGDFTFKTIIKKSIKDLL